MPGKQSTTTGVTKPWYPEGGPGRQLKARLASGEVMMGAMLSAHARTAAIRNFQHSGYDFVYVEYEHVTRSPGGHNRELPRFVEEIG